MPTDDRDSQFERALARHLRNASPDSACPDAETLAAYHKRTLSLEEMSLYKEHITGCERCQETLALVEQTGDLPGEEWEHQNELEPVERMALSAAMRPTTVTKGASSEKILAGTPSAKSISASAKPETMPSRPPWRWIVPIGAIAASVIVWIGVNEIRMQRLQQMSTAQMAENRPAPAQLPQPSTESVDRLRKEMTPAEQKDKEVSRPKSIAPVLPQMASRQRAESSTGAGAVPSSENNLAVQKQNEMEATTGRRLAKPQVASPPSNLAAKSRSLDSAGPPPPPAPSVTNSSATEKKKEEQRKSVTESVAVTAAAPAVNMTSAEMVAVEGRDAADLMKLAIASRRYIVAPGEKQAWRLGDAGKIERSTDRGRTWKLQQSGVTADLTAGFATSDKVCWVIGKTGTLLLTTDGGKHWKLISSPITEDLGGIHATDALHASIWDVPNRKSFETSDGGLTWKQTANE
jgi:hypothetical protein